MRFIAIALLCVVGCGAARSAIDTLNGANAVRAETIAYQLRESDGAITEVTSRGGKVVKVRLMVGALSEVLFEAR
jgi:uncharacterized protein YceK